MFLVEKDVEETESLDYPPSINQRYGEKTQYHTCCSIENLDLYLEQLSGKDLQRWSKKVLTNLCQEPADIFFFTI
jgi:hypothetical protein